jgi:hypothetical protein
MVLPESEAYVNQRAYPPSSPIMLNNPNRISSERVLDAIFADQALYDNVPLPNVADHMVILPLLAIAATIAVGHHAQPQAHNSWAISLLSGCANKCASC